MNLVRLTKEFNFEMAHTLTGYDGACSEIHGHSYRLFVTVIGEPCEDKSNPKCGMVIDFGLLKAIIKNHIIDRYDHSFLIRSAEQNAQLITTLKSHFEKIEVVEFQPTCENLIKLFAEIIETELPHKITLHSLRLHETATSFAEWFAEDNNPQL